MFVSVAEPVPLAYRVRYIVRGLARPEMRRVRLSLFMLLTMISVVFAAFRAQHLSPNATLAPKISAQASQGATAAAVVAPSAAPVSTPPTPSSTPAQVAAAATPQRCARANYAAPAQISLGDKPAGLIQVMDATSFYQVYGNNATQVRSQIQQCAPSGYAGETGYSMSWQYDIINIGGSCAIANAKIGLHINMILPAWQPSAAATGYVPAWQQFITNLSGHENGHATLDQQYARQMLTELQIYPASDCASIDSAVQARMNANIAALDAANNGYDTSTNHGATQGAIIP